MMAIVNFFKPKWRHSDSNIRRNAIQKGLKTNILVKIALTDSEKSLRILAINGINDQKTLQKLQTKIGEGFKQNILGQLAKITSGKEQIKLIQSINDLKVLMDLNQYGIDSEIRDYIYAQIILFVNPYGGAVEETLQLKTAKALKSQNVILYILQHSNSICFECDELLINKLTDTCIIESLMTFFSNRYCLNFDLIAERLILLSSQAGFLKFAIKQADNKKVSEALFSASAKFHSKETLDFYISKGERISDDVIDSAINHRRRKTSVDSLKMLLENGLDPNTKIANDNCTLLTRSIKNKPMLELLLQFGADPNINCYDGLPLSEAVRNGDFKTAELLLQNGANQSINKMDREIGVRTIAHGSRGSVLHLACALNQKELVCLLLKYGADPYEYGYNRGDGGPSPEGFTEDKEIIAILKQHKDQLKEKTQKALVPNTVNISITTLDAHADSTYFKSLGDVVELIVFRETDDEKTTIEEANKSCQWLEMTLENQWTDGISPRYYSSTKAGDINFRQENTKNVLQDSGYGKSISVDDDFIKNHIFFEFSSGTSIFGKKYYPIAVFKKNT